jgi:hypothetical protein
MEGFECGTPLVIPRIIQPLGHRSLLAVDSSFQSGVPGVIPTLPQSVVQAYLILNSSRYRWPWFITRATLGIRCRQSIQHGAGEVLNARVDCHTVVQFLIERNYIFQVLLEVGLFIAPEIRAMRCVLKGWATRVSMSTGRWSERSAEHLVRYIGNISFWVITMPKTLVVAEGV